MPGPMKDLPRAFLVDLDDTILDSSSGRVTCWEEAFARAGGPGEGDRDRVREALEAHADWYWSDPGRHRGGRLDLARARREIVAGGFARAGLEDGPLAARVADAYLEARRERLRPFPGAVEALGWFRERGVRLVMVTNGAGPEQRAKIDRFRLEPLFDAILVEGELGFGKPDPRVFREALSLGGAAPGEAWIAGDNLHWEIGPAQALGIHAIWVDHRGRGLPAGATVRPDRTVRSLADLVG